MEINQNWLAPCGLYCGVCGIMVAHRDNNEKFKQKLAGVYGIPAEELVCDGCLGEVKFKYCRVCPIRDCTSEHGYTGCHECDDFPCDKIANFPMPVGRKVMLRAIPEWRQLGTEKWVAAEEARYICPHCGYKLFRGAKRCRSCREEVDVD